MDFRDCLFALVQLRYNQSMVLRNRSFPIKQILVVLIVLLGLTAGCRLILDKKTQSPPPTDTRLIQIDPAHQACQIDQDCALVYVDCSGCGCGQPVHIRYVDAYSDRYRSVCADYRGPVCEVYCPETKLECRRNQCMPVPVN